MRNNVGPPLTLANMRKTASARVTATCEACGREADAGPRESKSDVIVGTAGAVECEAWVSAGVIESKGSWPSSREYETISARYKRAGGCADFKPVGRE